jgi:S1-C subfamily serine protease
MAETLKSLSDEMAHAVEIASRSTLRIEGRRRMPATGIVWSADGVIVTAQHVVEKEENITIGLPDGSTAVASLVGRDPTTDLAVLRATDTKLQPAAWLEAGQVKVGHLVLALGRPGDSMQAALGVINTISEGWSTPAGGQIDQFLRADVVMYPGFSGGPLVGADGKFIGLNTSALLRGSGISIPVGTLRRVIEALLAHGHIRRGYLGISTQPVRLSEGISKETGQDTGLLIISVEKNSPAETGGLLVGDTLISIGKDAIKHPEDLFAALSGDRAGSSVPIKIVRGGKIQTETVTVGERSERG